MAAPNIVNVTTITGVTTFHAGIAVTTGGRGSLGITTVVSNAASSGKVLKINSLVAAGIAATTGVTLQYFNNINHVSASSTVSIGMTLWQYQHSPHLHSLPKTIQCIWKKILHLVFLHNQNTGTIDVVCSFEEIS